MKKILIADDEAINREIIKKILTKEGYMITEASNGQEAIKKTKLEEIDLVLMDLMMPIIDGFKAIETITNNTKIPIIAISALSDKQSYQKAIQAGAVDYIKKPFDLQKLLKSIDRCLR